MTQITYKQSLACSIAFCNGTCCEIKLITNTHTYTYTHTHTYTRTYTHIHIYTHIHTHTHTYTHTHVHTHTLDTHIHTYKMADDTSQLEGPFNTLLQTTKKSGNLRKDLKQNIVESVSTLRSIFINLKKQGRRAE